MDGCVWRPNTPAFVISLDFELYWGVLRTRDRATFEATVDQSRHAVARMLQRFEEEEIAATWATVGFLACQDPSEVNGWDVPRDDFDAVIQGGSLKALFAPELVRRIAESPRQELATHTFTHFMCLEGERALDDFERDVLSAVAQGRELGSEITSIVFPRNQYTDAHLEVCRRAGLRAFRGNPPGYLHRARAEAENDPLVRGLRLLDAHVPLRPLDRFSVSKTKGLWNVAANRFLRTSPASKLLAIPRLRRILSEMRQAARNNRVYHLWWHPHNFGGRPDLSFWMLEEILGQFRILAHEYGMRSMTMSAVAGAAEWETDQRAAA